MKKREFIKTASVLLTGAALGGTLVGCKPKQKLAPPPPPPPPPPLPRTATVFELPALEYAADALQPIIDKATVEIHHGKHHAAYVANLNKALQTQAQWAGKSLEAILAGLSKADSDLAVRNNAGGHFNHSLYWRIINAPALITQKQPDGKLLEAINAAFGSVDNLLKQLKDAALGQFGSGWAWLSVGADKKLFVSATPNQDNPLMKGIVDKVGTPILGIDVWEHAYYLNYQNKRKDYVEGFLSIIRWDRVAEYYQKAIV